jgi:hypothetical protein
MGDARAANLDRSGLDQCFDLLLKTRVPHRKHASLVGSPKVGANARDSPQRQKISACACDQRRLIRGNSPDTLVP